MHALRFYLKACMFYLIEVCGNENSISYVNSIKLINFQRVSPVNIKFGKYKCIITPLHLKNFTVYSVTLSGKLHKCLTKFLSLVHLIPKVFFMLFYKDLNSFLLGVFMFGRDKPVTFLPRDLSVMYLILSPRRILFIPRPPYNHTTADLNTTTTASVC